MDTFEINKYELKIPSPKASNLGFTNVLKQIPKTYNSEILKKNEIIDFEKEKKRIEIEEKNNLMSK